MRKNKVQTCYNGEDLSDFCVNLKMLAKYFVLKNNGDSLNSSFVMQWEL